MSIYYSFDSNAFAKAFLIGLDFVIAYDYWKLVKMLMSKAYERFPVVIRRSKDMYLPANLLLHGIFMLLKSFTNASSDCESTQTHHKIQNKQISKIEMYTRTKEDG